MMTTREAIGIVAKQLGKEAVICTTGFTCRDMQAQADRFENFYMIGSMGLAASLGLGIALTKPDLPVVVFDGDGSALMGLGGLTMIGSMHPRNLVHIVFDNEVFASTGKQPTYSSSVSLDKLASAAGYPVVHRVQTAQELAAKWKQIRSTAGPSFLLVKCGPDAGPPMGRIRLEPEGITQRFMEAIQ